ncbi:hypothetical protein Pdw03_0337 [Penicillium digitatum]|uniref:Uncharacterized protein n=1 Tax=Penicillium digitatum TaxID=36651 RepID=A0A7T7BMP3_PENDI|nr:hypothetical protein Pdw03_0337 [Penicillium digitatum]
MLASYYFYTPPPKRESNLFILSFGPYRYTSLSLIQIMMRRDPVMFSLIGSMSHILSSEMAGIGGTHWLSHRSHQL